MIDLRNRTKQLALKIVEFYSDLPKTTEAQILGRQVLRSGTSIGAHYREAFRSRSAAEYISKLEVGIQELEETNYWLELLEEAKIIQSNQIEFLTKELDELIAIFVSCVKSARQKRRAESGRMKNEE